MRKFCIIGSATAAGSGLWIFPERRSVYNSSTLYRVRYQTEFDGDLFIMQQIRRGRSEVWAVPPFPVCVMPCFYAKPSTFHNTFGRVLATFPAVVYAQLSTPLHAFPHTRSSRSTSIIMQIHQIQNLLCRKHKLQASSMTKKETLLWWQRWNGCLKGQQHPPVNTLSDC